MENLNWSPSEKRLARSLFDQAVEAELKELMADFKAQAEAVKKPEEMWGLRKYLEQTEREFQSKYDYRYSQLIFILGHLVREGRIPESRLEGFSQDKRDYINRIVTL